MVRPVTSSNLPDTSPPPPSSSPSSSPSAHLPSSPYRPRPPLPRPTVLARLRPPSPPSRPPPFSPSRPPPHSTAASAHSPLPPSRPLPPPLPISGRRRLPPILHPSPPARPPPPTPPTAASLQSSSSSVRLRPHRVRWLRAPAQHAHQARLGHHQAPAALPTSTPGSRSWTRSHLCLLLVPRSPVALLGGQRNISRTLTSSTATTSWLWSTTLRTSTSSTRLRRLQSYHGQEDKAFNLWGCIVYAFVNDGGGY